MIEFLLFLDQIEIHLIQIHSSFRQYFHPQYWNQLNNLINSPLRQILHFRINIRQNPHDLLILIYSFQLNCTIFNVYFYKIRIIFNDMLTEPFITFNWVEYYDDWIRFWINGARDTEVSIPILERPINFNADFNEFSKWAELMYILWFNAWWEPLLKCLHFIQYTYDIQ